MKDYLGKPIDKGDKVLFALSQGTFQKGVITEIYGNGYVVEFYNNRNEKRKTMFYDSGTSVIKIDE